MGYVVFDHAPAIIEMKGHVPWWGWEHGWRFEKQLQTIAIKRAEKRLLELERNEVHR